MKKLLLITVLILALSVPMFAGTARRTVKTESAASEAKTGESQDDVLKRFKEKTKREGKMAEVRWREHYMPAHKIRQKEREIKRQTARETAKRN